MKAVPNIFHVLAIFLEYPLRTVWGIVPVLLAAWSILSFSGCGACGTARNGALSYTRDTSWHFFTVTEKPAEVHSCEYAHFVQGNSSDLCAFMVFFHNPGGFLSMCFCLWVGSVLVVTRCCRMSRLAVTCSTAVGSPMSPVSLSKKMLSCRCKKDKDSAQTDVPEHFLWVLFPSGYIQDAAKELANPWREGHSFKIRFWKIWSSYELRLNLLSL